MQINQQYEQTIRFRDLFFYLLYRWRSLLVICLAAILLSMGVFSFFGINAEPEDPLFDAEALLESSRLDEAMYRELIAGYQDYKEKSLLFRIDPFAKWVATKTYRIDQPDEGDDLSKTKAWYASYYAALWNNTTEENLQEVFGTADLQYIDEVVHMYDGNKAITGSNETTEGMGGVFSLKVFGVNMEEAEKRAEYISSLVENDCYQQINTAYPHQLVVTGESIVTEVDKDLPGKKEDVTKGLTSAMKSLENTLKKQEEYAAEAAELRKTGTLHIVKSSAKKGIAVGIACLAAAIACYAACYVLSGRLRSGDDLKIGYRLPVFAEFDTSYARKPGKGIDGLIEKWEKKGKKNQRKQIISNLQTLLRTNFAGQRLVLTGTLPENEYASLMNEIEKEKDTAETRLEASFLSNPKAMEDAGKADAVLIVEKKQLSKMSEIREMAEQLQMNKANVSGCIIL